MFIEVDGITLLYVLSVVFMNKLQAQLAKLNDFCSQKLMEFSLAVNANRSLSKMEISSPFYFHRLFKWLYVGRDSGLP